MYRIDSRALTAYLIIAIPIMLVATPLLYTQSSIYVKWVRVIRISNYNDYAYSICLGDGHLFAVGSYGTASGREPAVVRLDPRTGKVTGNLSRSVDQTITEIFDCEVFRGYVVGVGWGWDRKSRGQWYIQIVNTDLTYVKSYFDDQSPARYDALHSIASNGTHLVAVGPAKTKMGEDLEWIVAVFTKIDPPQYTKHTYNPSGADDHPYAVAFNPVTRVWWVVGNTSGSQWHIALFSRTFRLISSSSVSAGPRPLSIAFDKEGYTYVIGYNSLRKYDRQGNSIGSQSVVNGIEIVYNGSGDRLIAATVQQYNGFYKPYIEIYGRDLSWKISYILNHTYPSNIYISHYGKAVFDGENIYFAGWIQSMEGDYDWIIYCVNLYGGEPPLPIPEPILIPVSISIAALSIAIYIRRSIDTS